MMCRVDYGDTVNLFQDTDRRARKRHQCGECNRVIERGEAYHYEAGTYEGEFCHYRTCMHCMSAREWLSDVCSGWIYGEVADELHEHWHDGHADWWMGRILVGMRREWRNRDGSLMSIPPMPDTRKWTQAAA